MAAWSEDLPPAVSALVARVWLDPEPDGPAPEDDVVVTAGRAGQEDGAESFFVLQAGGRPRMLLPVGRPAAASGVVTAGPGLRPPTERALRQVLGVAVRTGVPERLSGGVLTVQAPPGEGLVEVLRRRWTPRVAAVGFSVRQITPNHKPTFIAVDDDGQVLGYGKVGWDEGTRRRVAVEAGLLERLRAEPRPGLYTAAVVADLEWRGREVMVTEPLPASARRFPRDARPPLVLAGHAAADGAELRVEDRADALLDQARGRVGEALAEALRRRRDDLVHRWGGCTLPAGLAHGDWVPWNLALDGPRLWAWDWEHGREVDVPALDLVHWHLQVARLVRKVPLPQAVGPALEQAAVDLAAVGLSREQSDAVTALGLMQMVARRVELATVSTQRAEELVRVLDGPLPA